MDLAFYKNEYLEQAKKHKVRKHVFRNPQTKEIMYESDVKFSSLEHVEPNKWGKPTTQGGCYLTTFGRLYPISQPYNVEWRKDQKVFWIEMWSEPLNDELYHSRDGKVYHWNDLPEHDDEMIKKWASEDVRSERNCRLYDTDKLVENRTMTIKRGADEKSRALDEGERGQLEEYRQALRDLTDDPNFPYIEFPQIPQCLYYYLHGLIQNRIQERERYKNQAF